MGRRPGHSPFVWGVLGAIAEAIEEYVDAGYDHVYVHQVGPRQDGFFDFYAREVLPKFG